MHQSMSSLRRKQFVGVTETQRLANESACAYTHMHTHRAYLDAVLEQESWHGEALFLVKWFTKYDDLLEEEDPPLLAARQKSRVLVCYQECVLQEQLPLGHNFTLREHGTKEGEKKTLHLSYLKFFPASYLI